jgi:adenine-specific DNA-methyltransferase
MTHNDQQSEVTALGFSPDALAERKNELLALLRQTAPEIVSDNQIDLERLKALLGQERIAPAEHYELSWAGKTEARREIQKTTSHTLRPSAGNPEQAPHMLIEGENLEVLRVLQKSYYGKVKMIYIDPPYNTGNDSFVYPDDYSETLDEYQRRTGEKNEAGYLNKQSLWKKNSKESGQYHSAWLSMMYPRLYLARNLLREDGVIFISICRIPDDHISQRRYPWFVARDIMYHAIEQFIQQAQGGQST